MTVETQQQQQQQQPVEGIVVDATYTTYATYIPTNFEPIIGKPDEDHIPIIHKQLQIDEEQQQEQPQQQPQQPIVLVDTDAHNFWPACLATYFATLFWKLILSTSSATYLAAYCCGLLGWLSTSICRGQSLYGRAGSATGCAFSFLSITIYSLICGLIVLHYHLPAYVYPELYHSAEDCDSIRGWWLPREQALFHVRTSSGNMTFTPLEYFGEEPEMCICSPLLLTTIYKGMVLCEDSSRFWFAAVTWSICCFLVFGCAARSSLKKISVNREEMLQTAIIIDVQKFQKMEA